MYCKHKQIIFNYSYSACKTSLYKYYKYCFCFYNIYDPGFSESSFCKYSILQRGRNLSRSPPPGIRKNLLCFLFSLLLLCSDLIVDLILRSIAKCKVASFLDICEIEKLIGNKDIHLFISNLMSIVIHQL